MKPIMVDGRVIRKRHGISRTNLIVHLIFFAFSAEIMLALILSAPGKKKTDPLPGGGFAPDIRPPAHRPFAAGGRGETPDLFSGAFWEAGIDQTANAPEPDLQPEVRAAEDTGILEPASPGNPRNPATGLPFTDKQMLRFDQVNQNFPENNIVPRRRKEVRELMRRQAELVQLERQAERGKASRADIDRVYEHNVKREEANLRLLDYLKSFAETDAQRARHRFLQKRSRRAIEQREEQRQRFLQKLENAE